MIPAPILALFFVGGFFAVVLTFGWLDVIQVTHAQHLIDSGSPYIDVDSHMDFAREHPRGSVNMPLRDVVYLARSLDRSVPLVVYGHFFRATFAARRLRRAGFQVLSLGTARTESM